MTHPILQLKVSRLRHDKHYPNKGDYFQARCYHTGDLVVFQLIKRMEGMLYSNLLGTPIHVRFNPLNLIGKNYVTHDIYEIYSAEIPPPALLQTIHDLPVGVESLTLLDKWFDFTRPYINSINEFL